MNKKQRNRKVVTQNNRNRMINRRYTSTIKTLTKLVKKTIKISSEEKTNTNYSETLKILNNLYSMIDKAVKKGVIHKNTAARKKSNVSKLVKSLG